MLTITNQLTRPQNDFIFSTAKFPLLAGGLGSGKTKGGTGRIINLMLNDVGINCAYYMPTYDLLRLRGITGVIEDLRESYGFAHSDFTLNKSENILKLYDYGSIIFRSYDNPERIVAYEVAHSIVDELDTLKKEKADFVWRKVVERNRQVCRHPHGNTVGCVTTLDQGEEGFCYDKWGKELQDGYQLIRASTYSNPFLPDDYIDSILKNYSPELARLYVEGEFVNLSGASIFNTANLLVDGKPVQPPAFSQSVFFVLDTAIKDGQKNDCTGITFFAFDIYPTPQLTILDWDLVQIQGAFLEEWIPSQIEQLRHFATVCNPRSGITAWVEDKASGTMLLQKLGHYLKPLPSKMTAIGKSGRAIACSGAVYNGRVKITQHAFDKVMSVKGDRKNHLLSQIGAFRIGIDNGADDLLDTFCYGALLTVSNINDY